MCLDSIPVKSYMLNVTCELGMQVLLPAYTAKLRQ